ncbi:MAG TPA: hypothetical protein VJ124_00905 [Pyrinomonadaceae bacterium]|nr:hypothetical protein [Pyrinomonadaceae bacterium]
MQMTGDQRIGERQRKRIVINLGGAPPGTPAGRRRTRWPRILALFVIVFVAVLALALTAAFLWWRHYQTTPPYSLALLIDAAQRDDTQAMDQIMDTDQILRNLVTQVTDRAVSRYGITLSPLLRKRVEALVPGLMPSVRQIVRDAVAQRVRELAEAADHRPFIVVALGIPYLVNISTEDDKATVSTTIDEHGVELAMERDGERWKVTSVKDDSIVQRIVDEIIKDLPAIGHAD